MYYRYMYVEDVENICLERYYESEYSNLPDIDIIKNVDGEFIMNPENNEFINQCLHDNNIERRIIKLHSLPKNILSYIRRNKLYGTTDCVFGNIISNHFVYVLTYENNALMPNFDDNLNPIIYLKDSDVAPYCDDADVIYSYDRIVGLPFDQRLSLFYKHY